MIAGAALGPLGAAAHVLEAPETVVADASGAFSYEIILRIDPGGALFGGGGWHGVENVDDGAVDGDCFCEPECFIEEGVYVETITSQLVIPDQPGLVYAWKDLCPPPLLEALTTILPFDATPVDVVPRPVATSLRVRPNPFSEIVHLAIDLERAADAVIDVVDVQGQRVRRLRASALPAGTSHLAWDGRDEAGSRVSGGIYFVRLRAGDVTRVKKLVFLRGSG